MLRRPVDVVIVGGGASGVLGAARILDATHAGAARVTIVEPSTRLGAGIAYGTDDPDHLLNVRAGGMTCDPSRPADFADWLGARGLGDPVTFAPRRLYRTYLQEHLATAADRAPDGALEVVHDTVWGVGRGPAGVDVALGSGRRIRADRVVVAIGNSRPTAPEALEALAGCPAWVPDPWAPGALEGITDGEVVLIGTGLTTVDIAITLGRQGDAAMTALSRTGLLPRRHVVDQPMRPVPDVVDLGRDGRDVAGLAERLRVRAATEDWRDLIDAVRPYANALWRRFDDTQREVFLSDLAREWDVHRHRMSPPTAERFDHLLATGRLSTHAGRVRRAEPVGDRVDMELELDGEVRSVAATAVINCTGPGRAWVPPANPLVADLFARGLARPDPHGLGLVTSEAGELVDAAGRVVPELLVIGPPRRGTLFETTAVPELRSQALHIADAIVVGGPGGAGDR